MSQKLEAPDPAGSVGSSAPTWFFSHEDDAGYPFGSSVD